MQTTRISQARPMTIWCLLAVALVVLAVAIGGYLFFMPGQGQPVQEKKDLPVVASP